VGVNHAGPEYACKQGWGFFNGPTTETVSTEFVGTIAAWNANAVRVPLNEHCWLDVNSNIPEQRRGHEYIAAITDYVSKLNAQGIVAILEPHWHAPGTSESVNGPMPNRDNSPRFWTSLATHFKFNPQVVFELVNEPHPDWNSDTDEAWRCWRDGGTCRGVNYTAAGMQELVTAIRDTGADQLILAGGVQYAHRLTQWTRHKPVDPLNNIAPAWHVYDFNACTNEACWDRENGALAAEYPLVVTEIGPHMPDLFSWLDTNAAGFQAWTWNRWSGEHDLITDWSGTPTVWGEKILEQMRAITGSTRRSVVSGP
jgi:endoglucanase